VVIFSLSLFVAYYFVEGLRAWFLFINSVVFAFILPLSWLRFFWWRLNIWGEAAALIIGLPLSYIIWFPLGFSNEQAHPFWQGFLLLFGLGMVTIFAITYLTRPERIETLSEFYRRCKPPGFWGPVVREFGREEREQIRRETITDLIDCFLGIVFCTAAILLVISLLGRHWIILAVSTLLCVLSGGLFILRWARRGVFRGLSEESQS
jgi:Na+/proline symporter